MTNPNTGKVPLTVPVTVNLPAHEGKEWIQVFDVADDHVAAVSWELRPIVSATVMVEMTREDAEEWANHVVGSRLIENVRSAVRAALARKPCPVMVTVTPNPKHYGIWPSRPCKLTEGHGGEHE